MVFIRLLFRVALLTTAVLLTSCGGGGESSGDVFPKAAESPSAPIGLDRFLLFPNPLVQDSGAYETDTLAYAQAYYAAIDPANAKDTLAKWKAANNFDSGTGTQVSVVFGDVRDLGYGRRMTVRQNADGTVAAYVENYLVEAAAGYGYSSVNLDAAVAQASRYHIATNAIEFSPGPAGGVSFAKYFEFSPSGQRKLTANLDGRGEKAMPGPCVSCHGGRADPLTPPGAGGNPLFALVNNSVSGARGDLLGQLNPLEVDALDFSATAGFTRADQEAAMKAINRMILCTYPIPAATGLPEDACRRVASPDEWQGTVANLLKAAYGGDGMPNPIYSDTYVPPSWSAAGQSSLYRNVVVPACRACHVLRGTARQPDIDFETFSGWLGYNDRTKIHVFDRGNMPMARIIYQKFQGSNMPATLAAFLQGQGITATDASGAPLVPGRPIADPGPDRVVPQGATTLSANMSLFVSSYQWSIVSGPVGASLTNANSAQPVFTAVADGNYVLQLVASSAAASSTPVQLRLVVNNGLFGGAYPVPSAIRFTHIKSVLQSAATGCTGCHVAGGFPPVAWTNIDRNGDGLVDATDDQWFYAEVRGRINFTDIVASPLLRKPSANHHFGGLRAGFDTSLAPGQVGRANYDMFVNWILNGAPQ